MVSAQVVREVLTGAREVASQTGELSFSKFNYDFVNLVEKIAIFFIVAIILDKIHWAISSPFANVASTIASAFGYNLPGVNAEPGFFKKLFGEGFFGLTYWDLVKLGAILLVSLEFYRYMANEKIHGRQPDYFTLAIFGGVILVLSSFTIPEIINKLKARQPNSPLGV